MTEYLCERLEKIHVERAPLEPFTRDWTIYRVRLTQWMYEGDKDRYSSSLQQVKALAAPHLKMYNDPEKGWADDYIEYFELKKDGWWEYKVVKAYLD